MSLAPVPPSSTKLRYGPYTSMLAISLAALLLGILCLYLDMKAYNWELAK